MLKKHLLTVGLAVLLATTSSVPIFAETTSTTSTTTTMENCGAYLSGVLLIVETVIILLFL